MSDDDVIPGDEDQPALFDVEPDWADQWQGMPEYKHDDLQPWQTVLVHFPTPRDRADFSRLVGQHLHARTKFIWYPKAEVRTAADKVYTRAEKVAPRYPIYVISKGRWESRLTQKALEFISVPYHVVVEPQELEQYAAVIPRERILTLPFSNLGLGGIPARNWVWEHAISTGATRHWILDDNIGGFCVFNDNLKVEVDSGATFCAVENWVDRYENVAMAAFNYDYFAPRKQGAKIRPITLNTRCYSGILLRNDLTDSTGTPIRWRGRYNEDTDLSLRILKEGLSPETMAYGGGRWATALFNALLMYKKPTLTMRGGNTDELYRGVEAVADLFEAHAKECATCGQCVDGYSSRLTPCADGREILKADGRWLMAESLREQHPEQVTVERKWRRWQHQVDYRAFAYNALRLRADVVVPEDDPYGLTLGVMPTGESHNGDGHGVERRQEPRAEARPDRPVASALGFLNRLEETPRQPAQEPGPASLGKAPEPEGEPATAEPEQPTAILEEVFDPVSFRDALAASGHRLLTRDGKFFVSESSSLTDAERAVIKQHREALVALAEPWVEPTVVLPLPAEQRSDEGLARQREGALQASGTSNTETLFAPSTHPQQTLAEFLGTAPTRVDVDFRPDEPPDLSGVSEVVLNFATNGLGWDSVPVGLTVSTMDGRLCRFLPFAFQGGGNLDEPTVKRWAERELRGKKITNANTRFDLHKALRWGVDLETQGCTFSDVQHTAALLDDRRKQFALDKLAEDYLPRLPKVARVDETRHHEYHASEVAAREKHTAELVWRLRDAMYPEVDKQELRQVQDLEDAVIPTVVEMEENGSPLDLELLEQYHAECVRRHDALLYEVAAEVGFAFDHTNKSWQRLFEKLGLPATDSVAEDVIGVIDHPTVRKAHFAAQYASLDSKTFKTYRENVGADGVLRVDINQLRGDDGGTVSGRFSIGYVQQVPNVDNHRVVFGDDLFPRRLFVAKQGDYLEADAAQIEFRLLVHYSQNARLIQAYRDDPWMSFHKKMQEMLVAYKPDMLYAHTKNYNFAAQYGARSIKLAVMMDFITAREGEEIRAAKRWDDQRLKTIKEIEAAYKSAHPEAGALLDRAAHLAKPACDEFCKRGDALHRQFQHRGYVKTLLGRRSRFPDGYKTYIGLNRVLQGTGADIMKQKLVELHKVRRETGLVMRVTNHDAVLGDATTPETLGKVREVLNNQSFDLKVPILWQIGMGKSWADCK